MPFTPAQEQAIRARNRELLVSAAAGSGKTRVLIERIADLILRDHLSVDRMLIVTFTKAAAGEMRERLQARMAEGALTDPRLRRQCELVDTAQISTIHSFCQSLVREFFQQVEIDPQSAIAEEAIAGNLRQEAMDEAMEWLYQAAADDADAAALTAKFEDRQIVGMLEPLYDFLLGQPNPFDWLDQRAAYVYGEADLERGELADTFWGDCRQLLNGMRALDQAEAPLLNDPACTAKLADTILSDRERTRQLLEESRKGLRALLTAAKGFKLDRMPTLRKGEEGADEVKERFDWLRKQEKALVGDIVALLPDSETAIAHLNAMQPALRGLSKLARRLDELYGEKKRERCLIDFADLEHMTLRILSRAEIRAEVSCRFDAIFVDEYQDVSGIQEAILNALKREDGNVSRETFDGSREMSKDGESSRGGMTSVGNDAEGVQQLAANDSYIKGRNSYQQAEGADVPRETMAIGADGAATVTSGADGENIGADVPRETIAAGADDMATVTSAADGESLGANVPRETIVAGADGAATDTSAAGRESVGANVPHEPLHPQSVFYVGDVKQSIYRFRQADPTLFMGKARSFSPEENAACRRISLNRNFRSREGVLDATNRVFRHVMRAEVTEIDYDDEAALYPGTPSEGDPATSLHVFTQESKRPDRVRLQAQTIGEEIRRRVGEPYWKKGDPGPTPLRYRDMVILAPVLSGVSEVLERTLGELGIPVYCEGRGSAMDSEEITQTLNHLRLMDNLADDLSLLAVLRSPAYGLNERELAEIRLRLPDTGKSYLEALRFTAEPAVREAARKKSGGKSGAAPSGEAFGNANAAPSGEAFGNANAASSGKAFGNADAASSGEAFGSANAASSGEAFGSAGAALSGEACGNADAASASDSSDAEDLAASLPPADDLARRCAFILRDLAHERFLLRATPLDEYLWGWLNRSGLYGFYGCQSNGRLRQANLRMLCQKAGDHVKNRGGDVHDFLASVVARAGVRGGDAPTVLSPWEDVVRVMTIHKSKGLEFPLVFVMGMEYELDGSRSRAKLAMHPRLGVALNYVNEEARSTSRTVLSAAIALREKSEARAEKARLLYVAMTRARDELVMLGSDAAFLKDAPVMWPRLNGEAPAADDAALPGAAPAEAQSAAPNASVTDGGAGACADSADASAMTSVVGGSSGGSADGIVGGSSDNSADESVDKSVDQSADGPVGEGDALAAYEVYNARSLLEWALQCVEPSDQRITLDDELPTMEAWKKQNETTLSTNSTCFPQKKGVWRVVFHNSVNELQQNKTVGRRRPLADRDLRRARLGDLLERARRMAQGELPRSGSEGSGGTAKEHASAAGDASSGELSASSATLVPDKSAHTSETKTANISSVPVADEGSSSADLTADPIAPPLRFIHRPFKVGATALVRVQAQRGAEAAAQLASSPELITEETADAEPETLERKRLPLSTAKPRLLSDLPKLPAFLRPPAEQTGVQRGVATHKALSLADYAPLRPLADDERALRAELTAQLAHLTAARVLTAEERQLIDVSALAGFFRSEQGRRALSAENPRREWSFNLRLPEEDGLIVQGVIDLCYQRDGAWELIDYKTDRVQSAEALWPLYGAQIELYRRALVEATGLPVREATLFSLGLGEGASRGI